MRFLTTKNRRRNLILASVAAAALVFIGGALYGRLPAQPTQTVTEIAPGLSLLSVVTNSEAGPQRYFLVSAQKGSWNLGLEVADANNILKKRSARNLAAQSGATVVINGGFFAYGGAAVGAVKVNDEWHRLPWKNRTALGWDEKSAKIAPLFGTCDLTLTFGDGKTQVFPAALNGFSLPGNHAALTDGFSVLTRRFHTRYKLKTGEQAVEFADEKPVLRAQTELSAEVAIPESGFLLVARGASVEVLRQIGSANWKVNATPADWSNFPQILGAGPRLIEENRLRVTEYQEEFRPDVLARGPRTCVGWNQNGDWLFLVADGRTQSAAGYSLPEIAVLFQQLGAVEAMNLDGGSSTQLVINGELVNTPSGYDPVNPLRPREVGVSNALILKAK